MDKKHGPVPWQEILMFGSAKSLIHEQQNATIQIRSDHSTDGLKNPNDSRKLVGKIETLPSLIK